MNKIKIMFATTTDTVAGAEKTILDMIRLIDREKFDPELVVFTHRKNGDLIERAQGLGIKTYFIDVQSKWQIWKLVTFWNVLRAAQPDILESFLFFDNVICRVFGTLARVPVVISGQQNAYLKRNAFRNFLDRLTIGFADGIISNSVAGKKWYVSKKYLSDAKIEVIKSGIDLGRLESLQNKNRASQGTRSLFGVEIPNGTLAVVSIGFLEEQKGISYLIEAAKILKDKKIPVVFFVIGDGSLRQSLEDFSRKQGVSDIIRFIGFRAEAAQYLHLFDLFVLPSLWEGLPNVVIEAMASRLPIVATNVGGVSEMIADKETGLLVEAGNPEMLADAIMELAKSEPLRKMLSQNAHSHAIKVLTAQKMAQSREQYYERLLEQTTK